MGFQSVNFHEHNINNNINNSFDRKYWTDVNKLHTEPPEVLPPTVEYIDSRLPDVGNVFIKPATAVLLLLMVAVSGNFTAELLGCNTQAFLSKSMVAKHGVLLSLIYFTMDSDQFGFAPHERFLYSILLWGFFVLYTHQTIEFTIISTVAIISIFIVNDYIKLAQKENKSTEIYDLILKILYLVIVISIVIGNYLYYNKQSVDYRNTFSFFTFIFGKKDCDGMIE